MLGDRRFIKGIKVCIRKTSSYMLSTSTHTHKDKQAEI